jgi:methionyl-tRNA formyltransferase
MRILFLGNNRAAAQIVGWLRDRGEQIAGLVIHPAERQREAGEILSHAGVASDVVFDGSRVHDPEVVKRLQALSPDIGVSVSFGYILKPEILELCPQGWVNLHPALLPFNRGAFPNVWSIIEGTPAGVTLHYMDSGVDTGDIVAQVEVMVEPTDPGETLYRKLEQAGIELFMDTWPSIRAGRAPRRSQPAGSGTIHRARDVERIDEIVLDRSYSAKELLNLLRARTFPPYPSAYFMDNGRKVFVRVQLEYDCA